MSKFEQRALAVVKLRQISRLDLNRSAQIDGKIIDTERQRRGSISKYPPRGSISVQRWHVHDVVTEQENSRGTMNFARFKRFPLFLSISRKTFSHVELLSKTKTSKLPRAYFGTFDDHWRKNAFLNSLKIVNILTFRSKRFEVQITRLILAECVYVCIYIYYICVYVCVYVCVRGIRYIYLTSIQAAF